MTLDNVANIIYYVQLFALYDNIYLFS